MKIIEGKRKEKIFSIIVDDEDYEMILPHSIWVQNGYPFIWNNKKNTLLHRFILEKNNINLMGKFIDHKNRNPLDCRKENLRIATSQQNTFNRGSNKNALIDVKGVSPNGKKFIVKIRDKKEYYVGIFDNIREAGIAYDMEAKRLHGDFAYINYPDATEEEKQRILEKIRNPKKHCGNSIYRGVSKRASGRFLAQIQRGPKNTNLGTYDDEKEAAMAYNIAAKQLLGDKAKLNIID